MRDDLLNSFKENSVSELLNSSVKRLYGEFCSPVVFAVLCLQKVLCGLMFMYDEASIEV